MYILVSADMFLHWFLTIWWLANLKVDSLTNMIHMCNWFCVSKKMHPTVGFSHVSHVSHQRIWNLNGYYPHIKRGFMTLIVECFLIVLFHYFVGELTFACEYTSDSNRGRIETSSIALSIWSWELCAYKMAHSNMHVIDIHCETNTGKHYQARAHVASKPTEEYEGECKCTQFHYYTSDSFFQTGYIHP